VRTLAIANQKGGAQDHHGRQLAATLGERGCSVLLLDLDRQASASHWYGITDAGRGCWTSWSSMAPEAWSSPPGLPASICARLHLAGRRGEALAGESGAETRLRAALEALPADRWPMCSSTVPDPGLLTVNAWRRSRRSRPRGSPRHGAPVGSPSSSRRSTSSRPGSIRLALAGILGVSGARRTRHAQEVVEELRRARRPRLSGRHPRQRPPGGMSVFWLSDYPLRPRVPGPRTTAPRRGAPPTTGERTHGQAKRRTIGTNPRRRRP